MPFFTRSTSRASGGALRSFSISSSTIVLMRSSTFSGGSADGRAVTMIVNREP